MKQFVTLNIFLFGLLLLPLKTPCKIKWEQDLALSECLNNGNEPINMLLGKACVDHYVANSRDALYSKRD